MNIDITYEQALEKASPRLRRLMEHTPMRYYVRARNWLYSMTRRMVIGADSVAERIVRLYTTWLNCRA